MEEERFRLFVGGLASDVSARDLEDRFAPLGIVKAILFPASQAGSGHRGFAYVDFVPATDASLRKLLSAYNGCKWRGGVLRVEKAKEHYSDRLKREWSTDESLLEMAKLNSTVAVVQQPLTSSVVQKPVHGNNSIEETNGVKIFFPKMRKLKSIPLKGLGKHKRSFERVESTPLHLLPICANDDKLLSGSYGSMPKLDTVSEADEISQAIIKERERQLDLLNRLFPNDTPSTSLEYEQVVDLEGSEPKHISEGEDMVNGPEEPSCVALLAPQTLEDTKPENAGQQQQKGILEDTKPEKAGQQQQKDISAEKLETSVEDDPTSVVFAEERAKQLELMKGLFPTEVVSPREPEAVQAEGIKLKRKRKAEVLGVTEEICEPSSTPARSSSTEQAEQLQRSEVENNPLLSSGRNSKARMDPGGALESSCSHANVHDVAKTEVTDDEEKLPEPRNKSHSGHNKELQQVIKPESCGLKKKRKHTVLQSVSSPNEQESDQVLQAKSTDIVSPPLPRMKTKKRTVRQSDEPSTVDAESSLEPDLEMTLNLGDDSMPLETAQDEEKRILRVMAGSSLKGISENMPHLVDNHLPLVNPGEEEQVEVKEKSMVISDNTLDEDAEMTLNLGDDSTSLETAHEQERQFLISMFPLHTPSRRSGLVTKKKGTRIVEPKKAEVVEDSKGEENLEPAPASLVTESKPTQRSLQESNAKSSMAHQPDQFLNGGMLAMMCKFRATEGVMCKPEPSGSAGGKELVVSQGKEDQKSLQQVIEAEISQGQQLNELPPSSDQRLTRAAWKSLVGETGRVVFSLRELTGSSLPQVPSPAKETEDLDGEVEPLLKKIQSNPKLPVSSAEKSKVITKVSGDPHIRKPEFETVPVTRIVGTNGLCPFMRSENAEKEWLATKSNLRSDYRAKHKQAARKMNKLWGKGP